VKALGNGVKCDRENGDGLSTFNDGQRQRFCDCAVCAASRWPRAQVMRGALTQEQREACRDLIAHLGGSA